MLRNDYGLFFTYNNLIVRLPVNPAELPESKESDYGEYNVLGLGPITIPRTPKQKEITISSYFPGIATRDVLTVNGFQPPEFYIQFFEAAMNEKRILTYTPVRYMEDGTPFYTQDAGWKCLVLSFNKAEKGGETGDFYYDLLIREYRDYSPERVTLTPTSTKAAIMASAPTREVPNDVFVRGDQVIANGEAHITPSKTSPSKPVSNVSGRIGRIDTDGNGIADVVYVMDENGEPVGWIKKNTIRKKTDSSGIAGGANRRAEYR